MEIRLPETLSELYLTKMTVFYYMGGSVWRYQRGNQKDRQHKRKRTKGQRTIYKYYT